MAFYHYRQNNSGGSFDFNKGGGISVSVIIEAEDAGVADFKAERLGLYFNGVDDGLDCDCCGDRWGNAYGGGDPVPSIYGKDVSKGMTQLYRKWSPDDMAEGYIHYADGRVVPIEIVEESDDADSE